jgi:hypothetical protein
MGGLHIKTIETKAFKASLCGGGLEYLHRTPASRGDKREPSARGYNWATLFLGDINTETWTSRLGVSDERVKYGHEFCGTSTQE